MKLPGWLWTVIITGATTFLVALQSGIADNLDTYYAPLAIAAIGAILKAIETYKAGDTVTRSVEAPRGKVRRFLLG